MHRIDTVTAQKDKFGAGKNGFTRGNPQTGVPATDLDDDYFDTLQEELAAIVEAAGDTLDKAKRNQVLQAAQKLFAPANDTIGALAALVGAANKLPYFTGPKAAALTDLTSVGRQIISKATTADVLTFLGLGSFKYGAPMIGQLIQWPLSQMPHEIWPDCGMEFIPYMGQSFDAAKYPLLSQLHPANVLPADMRAEFMRGWDNSRGVDVGRTLMGTQLSAAPDIRGTLDAGDFSTPNPPTGAFQQTSSINIGATGGGNAGIDRSMEFRASLYNAAYGRDSTTEVRSRNVAWNMIVRAK